VVQTRTMIESNEARLSTRADSCIVSAKAFVSLGTSGAAVAIPLSTDAFGSRVAAIANQFSKWRIEKLIFQITPPYVSTTGVRSAYPTIVGVMDDNSGEGGSVQIPDTYAEIDSLRCSRLQVGDEPLQFKWNPINYNTWYYTEAGVGGNSDPRLVIPASIVYLNGAGAVSNIELHYTLRFEGAKQSTE
jgi:hypothetical protein